LTAIYPFSSNSFTGRGFLWQLARSQISLSHVFGSGAFAWASIIDRVGIGKAAIYSTHNQFLDISLTAGLFGVAYFLYLIFRLTRLETDLVELVVPILALMPLERPVNLFSLDWATWTLPMFVALTSLAMSRRWSENGKH